MKEIIELGEHHFKLFISQSEIENRVREMAKEIESSYDGDEIPIFLTVLNGAFRFASTLVTSYQSEVQTEFVRVKSYEGMKSASISLDMELPDIFENRHVVILEDIVDTGQTIAFLKQLPQLKNIKSLKIASLLFKPEAFQGSESPNFVGFSISNLFVVGYGLDYMEKGRALNHIYQLHS